MVPDLSAFDSFEIAIEMFPRCLPLLGNVLLGVPHALWIEAFRYHGGIGFGCIPFSDSNLHHLNGAGVVLFFSWCFSVGVYSKGCYTAL